MLKKKDIAEGIVESCAYPNRALMRGPEGEKIYVKNGIPGETLRVRITKKRETHLEGKLLEVVQLSDDETEAPACDSFPGCGGCLYQRLPYEEQLLLKEKEVRELLGPLAEDAVYDGIVPSPEAFSYRNKMEFSFGTEVLGGPLVLGLHKRGTTYDILPAKTCAIVHEDVRRIVACIEEYAKNLPYPTYHKLRNTGFWRHLLVRRSEASGDILIVLLTTSEYEHDFTDLAERLRSIPMTGSRIAGFLHGINDLPADMVQYQRAKTYFGRDEIEETLLGLSFKISVFSFFQTNTRGAERLYDRVRSYLQEYTEASGKPPVLYDLYSGTGTIAQILAPMAERVYGIELVEEAVRAARENAERNGLANCTFYAGDVLKMLDEIEEKPDYIILDPPREGIVPKALAKIMAYDVPSMIYISCKATSFVRDAAVLKAAGWKIKRWSLVDLFPQTPHCEVTALFKRL